MRRAFLVGVAIVFSVGGMPGFADEPKAKQAEAPAKTLRVLSQPTSIQFVDTPVSEAAKYLSEMHKVKITLDEAALKKAKLSLDEPITGELNGIQLRSALNLMLRQVKMEWRVVGDGIVIGPETPKKPGAKPAPKVPDSPATVRTREALKDETSFQFDNLPLKDGLDYLSDLHQITIILDERGMREAKIATDATVTKTNAPKATLETGLASILTPLGLEAVIEDEVLLVRPAAKKPAAGKK